MVWPPQDGKPYMPANGMEGEGFFCEWCADCALEDEENNDFCEILSNSFFGQQPKEWTWRSGQPHCSAFMAFEPGKEKAEPRCPLTMEMF